MRDYYFRGKRKDTGEWSYGSLQCFKGCSIFDTIWNNFMPVQAKTVGQYIGIDDKNSKRIYEGDLVYFKAFRGEPHWIGEVVYDESCATYIFKGVMPYRYDSNNESPFEVQISSRDKDTFEVIGNKWDNPELLGEEGYIERLHIQR